VHRDNQEIGADEGVVTCSSIRRSLFR
jgi:hypothetical protein